VRLVVRNLTAVVVGCSPVTCVGVSRRRGSRQTGAANTRGSNRQVAAATGIDLQGGWPRAGPGAVLGTVVRAVGPAVALTVLSRVRVIAAGAVIAAVARAAPGTDAATEGKVAAGSVEAAVPEVAAATAGAAVATTVASFVVRAVVPAAARTQGQVRVRRMWQGTSYTSGPVSTGPEPGTQGRRPGANYFLITLTGSETRPASGQPVSLSPTANGSRGSAKARIS